MYWLDQLRGFVDYLVISLRSFHILVLDERIAHELLLGLVQCKFSQFVLVLFR